MSTDKSKAADNAIEAFIKVINEKYEKAEAASPEVIFLTTDELIKPFVEFSGKTLTRESVFEALNNEGFEYKWIDDRICWLMMNR